MPPKDDHQVLNTSDEAAHFVTNISGWVSRHGRFYGTDERLARWDGATHVACEVCGIPVTKSWLKCDGCIEKADKAKYAALPRKPWNGEPLYSEVADEYFFCESDLSEYLEDHEATIEDLRLLICEPEYATEIDPDDYYNDHLPEDREVDAVLKEAFEALNKVIREHKVPLSWHPGKYAVQFYHGGGIVTHDHT